MSRITKELAKQVAIKLTEQSRLAVEVIKKEYQQLVTDIYISTTPKEIKEAFKKHPEWFYTRGQVILDGHGFRWERVPTTQHVIANAGTEADLKMTSVFADKIMKSKRKYDKSKEEYEKLKTETENALITLRTYRQIIENIPAAEKFMPPPISNALVVNFDNLNKRISQQPDLQKVKMPV